MATDLTSATIAATERSAKTIIGIQRELEAAYGAEMTNDARTTLNTKYNVAASLLPTRVPMVKYAGIGINGRHAINDTFRMGPNEILTTNQDLYLPLPWRAVPLAQDLADEVRASYRLREVREINGTAYVLYWLKKLNYTSSKVVFTKTDPTTQIETAYNLDPANLTPTPPTSSTNGVVSNTSDEINVTLSASLTITGAEVVEAVNVLYDGDMTYATLSEIGLYTGEDQVFAARTAGDVPFNYTEAAFAQLAEQFTWGGTDFSNQTRSENILFRFLKQDVILSN